MDNMLYIVAGLVIILLIAVLIMRRNKAQPNVRPIGEVNKTKVKQLPADNSATVVDSATGATKFDSLTVAERFIEQQRYDKAIETLERGLIQKPHDPSLLLKLLNIYVVTTQPDSFYKTYDAIYNHADADTIAQANELKALFDQEHSQTTQILARNETSAPEGVGANKEGYDSLDFDVSTVPSEVNDPAQNNIHKDLHDVVLDSDDTTNFSSVDLNNGSTFSENNYFANENVASGDFDLTLDDLENDSVDNETAEFSDFDSNNSNDSNDANNQNLSSDSLSLDDSSNSELDDSDDLATLDSTTLTIKPDSSFRDVGNISEDFSLNFDEPSTASPSITADLVETKTPDSMVNAPSTDDFVLDFDDLATDSSVTSDSDFDNQIETAADSESFDFALDLDEDKSPNSATTPSTLNSSEAPAIEEDLGAITDLDFNDNVSTDSSDSFDFNFDLNDAETYQSEQSNIVSVDFNDADTTAIKPVITESNNDNELSSVFDDNTPISADFDSDSSLDNDLSLDIDLGSDEDFTTEDTVLTPTMPTAADSDFASKFSADFDFVNDLDNNQVTLDLAGKYLELGEYDSARRLLNEVVDQGSSEQQNQAQLLLQRTA